MSEYNPERFHEWYLKNKERLKPIRKEYNKKWRKSEHGKEFDKKRNASPERKSYRKKYKQTEAGKRSNAKYQKRPEIKARRQSRRLEVRYGITTEQYWQMVAQQGGVCAICGKSDGKKLHVDHSHKTSQVRGLLCGNCNRGIGLFKDSVETMLKAVEYLNGQIHKDNGSR